MKNKTVLFRDNKSFESNSAIADQLPWGYACQDEIDLKNFHPTKKVRVSRWNMILFGLLKVAHAPPSAQILRGLKSLFDSHYLGSRAR